jgi:hypothetical protein
VASVTIAPVVEGHGEVKALPLLLRRVAYDLGVYGIEIHPPIRAGRSTLATAAGISSVVEQAAYRVPGHGGILVLFDADDDCPVDLVSRLLASARNVRPDKAVAFVVATREFEAWFLAAASSLAGKCGLPEDFAAPADPETKRDAKGWISDAMRRGSGHPYKEVIDQSKLASVFDMKAARSNS